MAVEFILIGLANAAIGHYGVKVFDWFDGRVRSAVGAEGEDAEAVAQRETPMESTEKVKAALVSWYTNADEDQLTRLVDAALKPPHLNEVAPTEQLQLFRSRLRGIFEVAHTLPRGRAVVPGWFHSTACITLLDARSSSGSWARSRLGAVLADPLAAENRTLNHVLRACDINRPAFGAYGRCTRTRSSWLRHCPRRNGLPPWIRRSVRTHHSRLPSTLPTESGPCRTPFVVRF